MDRIAPARLRTFVVAFLFHAAALQGTSHAYVVELAWRPIEYAAGYNVYLALDNRPFSVPLEIGYLPPDENNEVRFDLKSLPLGPSIRIAISSYDAQGIEGPRSNVRVVDYAAAAPFSDSDGDGLTDAEEDLDLDGHIDPGETDRNSVDTDGDGLSDRSEIFDHGTDPLRADSDGDGLSDGVEVGMGTDPNDRRSGEWGVCGNGLTEPGEECDQGFANSDATPGACRTLCTLPDVCGDATGDRRITATDASAVMHAATGANDDCPYSRCDANGDGRITASDTMLVLRYATDPDESLDCSTPLTVSLTESRTYETLEFSIDYSSTGSTFVGEGLEVVCSGARRPGRSISVANMTSIKRLLVEMHFPGGIAGPTEVLSCRFVSLDFKPLPEDFEIVVAQIQPVGGQRLRSPALDIDL